MIDNFPKDGQPKNGNKEPTPASDIVSPATQLGLVNEQFLVRRGNGVVEDGWIATSIFNETDPSGAEITRVRIIKEDSDSGETLTKDVRLKKLMGWQPTESTNIEDDTVPNRIIASAGGVALSAKEQNSTNSEESPLERARRLHDSIKPSWKLLLDPDYQDALDALDTNENRVFNEWLITKAANRAPKLLDIVKEAPVDDMGNLTISEEKMEDLANSLRSVGVNFGLEPPAEAELNHGIEKAKRLVSGHGAERELAQFPFMSEREVSLKISEAKKRYIIKFEPGQKLYVDPEDIISAGSFDSWMGRGPDGLGDKSYTRKDGVHVIGRSINAILDYASRDTPLPKLEWAALTVVLSKFDKPVISVSNGGHRVAASKLRGERLGFSSMIIYDAR